MTHVDDLHTWIVQLYMHDKDAYQFHLIDAESPAQAWQKAKDTFSNSHHEVWGIWEIDEDVATSLKIQMSLAVENQSPATRKITITGVTPKGR